MRSKNPCSHLFFLLFLIPTISIAQPVRVQPPQADRVAELAEAMRAHESPVIHPVSDRAFWDAAADVPYLVEHIERAQGAMDLTVPDDDTWREAYLAYNRTGDRSEAAKLVNPIKDSIRLLTIAEAIENKGRFLPVLESRLRGICSWPTWVLNAEDPDLDNLEGRTVEIDLGASMLAADLASSLAVLGEVIDADVKDLVLKHLRDRVLEPFRQSIEGEREAMWWMTRTNNWNAVCLSGVVVTAICIEDPESAAWFAASAERLIQNFLFGFSIQGYCSEGLGYWGYGYGHFVILTEYIRRSTGGQLDLFDQVRAQLAGLFPFRMEIVDGVYPAFADSTVDGKPNETFAWYVARRMGLDASMGQLSKPPAAESFNLYGRLIFIGEQDLPVSTSLSVEFDPLRHYYGSAGVLVMRAPGSNAFGLAVKAGNNAENHNHNDVGSFVLVSKGRPLLCDPGKEVYTRDTFSDKRYERAVHNSYGHSVPVVNGKLQATGKAASGRIMGKQLQEMYDSIVINLNKAYPVDELRTLMRAIQLNREERTVTLSDSLRMDTPGTFSTALISYGDFEISGDTIHVTDGPASASITVRVQGANPVYRIEELEADWQAGEYGETNPKRLEIALDRPVAFAIIQCTITLPED